MNKAPGSINRTMKERRWEGEEDGEQDGDWDGDEDGGEDGDTEMQREEFNGRHSAFIP